MIQLAKFISTEDWSEFLHNGLIAAGVVPDEEIIMIMIDLTLDFFAEEEIIDFYLEME